MKNIFFLVPFLIIILTGVVRSDSWQERPDMGFYTHPLYELSVSTRIFVRGEIIKVLKSGDYSYSSLVKVMISSGRHKGKVLYAKNLRISSESVKVEKKGMNVVVSYYEGIEPQNVVIESYDRTGKILILILMLIGLVLFVGRKKSMYALITPVLSILLLKLYFIPKILSGGDPIIFSGITVTIIVIVTLIVIGGFSRKTLVAITGSLSGLGFIMVFACIFFNISKIYGYHLEEIQLLNHFSSILAEKSPQVFRDLLVSVMVIGATGIVMDIAISATSSIDQLKYKYPDMDMKTLFKKGMNIGRKIVASMANTLIFAYMGISLGSLLVKNLHIRSAFQFFNTEFVHIEFYRSFIGTLGYLICVVVTVGIGSVVYSKILTGKK